MAKFKIKEGVKLTPFGVKYPIDEKTNLSEDLILELKKENPEAFEEVKPVKKES